MIGSFNCVYECPCGWCSRLNKQCDKKPEPKTKSKAVINNGMRIEYETALAEMEKENK